MRRCLLLMNRSLLRTSEPIAMISHALSSSSTCTAYRTTHATTAYRTTHTPSQPTGPHTRHHSLQDHTQATTAYRTTHRLTQSTGPHKGYHANNTIQLYKWGGINGNLNDFRNTNIFCSMKPFLQICVDALRLSNNRCVCNLS